MNLFDLPEEMRAPHPNTNRVHVFQREELLLCTLIKLALGSTNIEMVEEVIWDSDSQWRLGHK